MEARIRIDMGSLVLPLGLSPVLRPLQLLYLDLAGELDPVPQADLLDLLGLLELMELMELL